MIPASSLAIVIVAGGEATRLPGKLERAVGDIPLLLRVYRNMRGAEPVYVSARATFSSSLDADLECPIVVDRWPKRGPIGGIASVLAVINQPQIFVVAGDAPAVTRTVLDALRNAWQPGDEAALPEHDGRIEPLAALYDSAALRREATLALQSGNYTMHAIVARLAMRRVALNREYFLNVNTPADLERIGPATSKELA